MKSLDDWLVEARAVEYVIAAVDLQAGGSTYDKDAERWIDSAQLVLVLRRPGINHSEYRESPLGRWRIESDDERDRARELATELAGRLGVPVSTLSFDQGHWRRPPSCVESRLGATAYRRASARCRQSR